MFIDRAKIYVKAGTGGDGASSFRREKYIAKGGPDGGDGGRGGNIFFIVDSNQNTLLDFRYKRKFLAPNGDRGDKKNMFGRSGESIYINVPPGTIVKDAETEKVLADLTEVGQEFLVARGGRGGRGNARFVTSVHRAPTTYEKGEPGEEKNLLLELKLLADVGLVGYPSVGKSSILSRVSAAKPEIAEYHFTTLTPVLGVVSIGAERSFVLADIPGLIEGAHEGKGLGHEFLRHIERTKVLIHVLDVSGMEGRDPIEDFYQINQELSRYSDRLAKRKQIIAANKMDLPDAQNHIDNLKEYMDKQGIEVYPISAATGEGITELMNRAYQLVLEYVEEPQAVVEEVVYEAEPAETFKIRRDDDGAFVVEGKDIEKLVAMTNFENDDSLRRFQMIWRKLAIEAALKERGIKEGDLVRIRDMEFEYKS